MTTAVLPHLLKLFRDRNSHILKSQAIVVVLHHPRTDTPKLNTVAVLLCLRVNSLFI